MTQYDKLLERVYRQQRQIFFVLFFVGITITCTMATLLLFVFYDKMKITYSWYISLPVTYAIFYCLHFNFYLKKFLKAFVKREIKKYRKLGRATSQELLVSLEKDGKEAMVNFKNALRGERAPENCYEKRDKQIFKLQTQVVRLSNRELFFFHFTERYCIKKSGEENLVVLKKV
jgi:hypothetical protein